MSDIEEFENSRKQNIARLGESKTIRELANLFIRESAKLNYSYNFNWLGVPIIQYPQDIVAMQELVWKIKPDLIIETGIARGGSLIFYASLLELIGKGEVVGIDIDIRAHNRKVIEDHPLFKRIKMIEGSSVAQEIIEKVKEITKDKKKVLVCLDSSHTYEHVAKEIELYSPFVTKDSYLVVFDTIIEDLPDELFKDRPWKKGNNPRTAVDEFLKKTDRFVVDKEIENKILISVAPDGYLKRVR